MRRSLVGSLSAASAALVAALALATLSACSGSKPNVNDADQAADGPSSSDPSSDDPSSGEAKSAGDETTQIAMPAGTAKPAGHDDTIPDDYTMSNGDCNALGQRLTTVVRQENMAQLSPKLSEEKRSTAEENIDRVATKLGTDWTSGCQKSLVDKVVDRAALKCAMEARTSKAFEACMSGPPEEKKK